MFFSTATRPVNRNTGRVVKISFRPRAEQRGVDAARSPFQVPELVLPKRFRERRGRHHHARRGRVETPRHRVAPADRDAPTGVDVLRNFCLEAGREGQAGARIGRRSRPIRRGAAGFRLPKARVSLKEAVYSAPNYYP